MEVAQNGELNQNFDSGTSQQYSNFIEVLEWAQGETNADIISSSTKNAGHFPTKPENKEVLQWAQNVTGSDQFPTESPIISGAELALLTAEANALKAGIQSAQIPANPSAPASQEIYEAEVKNVETLISENIDVLHWAQRVTASNTGSIQLTENLIKDQSSTLEPSTRQAGRAQEIILSSLDDSKLLASNQIFAADQKY